MTWWEKAATFLMGGSKSGDATSRAFKSAACGSHSKKGKLARRQIDLAERLEELFSAYEERLEELSSCIRNLDDKCSESEAARIRGLQDAMRLAFLRLDAAARSAQELKRDLAYWQNRMDEAEARERIEILVSELALRGEKMQSSTHAAAAPKPQNRVEPVNVLQEAPCPVCTDQASDSLSGEPLFWPEEEHLLRAIREATREAERWHAIPNATHDEDALIQVHHVRDLNGILKTLDKQKGIRRDRLPLAVRIRVWN